MRSFPIELTAKVKESLQTLGNASQPKLKIAVSRAKTTVTDSNYWTVETIREKAGLGDISVAPRRLYKNYGGPDRLYEIHVDNGEVLTSLREYPDKLKQGWQPQFSLGLGSAVAIAFDGEWELYRKVWRLRTHEEPWIFWVNNLGELYAQLWNDEETRVQLASGVDGSKGVKAIRGWKELNQGQNDQGLVIAYVKMEGTVAYRNYCIQSDLTYTWETEKAVTGFTGLAQGLGLFLTNDYRLGFVVNTSLNDIWWMVTNRTWVGMATPPENITIGVNPSIDIIPINTRKVNHDENIVMSLVPSIVSLYGSVLNSITNIENIDDGFGDWGRIIVFETAQQNIGNITILIIDDVTQLTYAYDTIEIINTKHFIVHIASALATGFNNAEGTITIKVISSTNEAGILFNEYSSSFLPINLVPEVVEAPTVLEVWNE